VGLDWGDGEYARTAAALAPAAEVLADAAGVGPGARALDVACGIGSAALAAAARGARVTGVDASPGLVELAAARARAAGADARFVVGRAEALPEGDAAFESS
jgi:ubiquinone/menaquinone biosynthesis C-methylase UbiE